MSRLTASLTISGEAGKVLQEFHHQKNRESDGWHNCHMRLTFGIRAKCADGAGSENYMLPDIMQGNGHEAIKRIVSLERQGRINAQAAEEAVRIIEDFIERTGIGKQPFPF